MAFPQRDDLVGNSNWTGDAEADAQISQDNFDSLALLLNQLKRRIVSGLARISSAVIYGLTNGSDAAAGYIGEYVESAVAEGSVGSWVTDTGKTVTSISLTAGDWDVEAFGSFAGGAITGTASAFSISTADNTIQGTAKAQVPATPTATSEVYLAVARRRVSITVTTTIYLVGLIKFSAGTPTAGGTISARRVR